MVLMTNKIAQKIRQKFKKQKEKDGIKKICPVCGKDFQIFKDSIYYTINDVPVHDFCFFKIVKR